MPEIKSAPGVELVKYSPQRMGRHRSDLLPIDYQRYLVLGTVYIGGLSLEGSINALITERHPDVQARAELCNCLESTKTLSYQFFNYGPDWNNDVSHWPQTRPTGVVVLPDMRFRADGMAMSFRPFHREEQSGRRLRPSFFDEVSKLCREQRTPLVGITKLQLPENFSELDFDVRDEAIKQIASNEKLAAYLYRFFNGTALPK